MRYVVILSDLFFHFFACKFPKSLHTVTKKQDNMRSLFPFKQLFLCFQKFLNAHLSAHKGELETFSESQKKILDKIKRQIDVKLAMKKGLRKKVKKFLDNLLRRLRYWIFQSYLLNVRRYDGKTRFGCDVFGRDIEDCLRKYVEILKARNLQIHTVIALGSRAKGVWNPDSDVDVTIIGSNLPKEGKKFPLKGLFNLINHSILSDRPLYFGVEPSGCCSKNEFLEKLENFDIQALDAVFYGKVIYDDGFWEIVLEKYREMKEKYELDKLPLKSMLFPL